MAYVNQGGSAWEAKKVDDSVQLFTSDTLKGGAKKPELVKVGGRSRGGWLGEKRGFG